MIYSHTANQDAVRQKKGRKDQWHSFFGQWKCIQGYNQMKKDTIYNVKNSKELLLASKNGYVDTRHTNIVLNMLKSNLPNPEKRLRIF